MLFSKVEHCSHLNLLFKVVLNEILRRNVKAGRREVNIVEGTALVTQLLSRIKVASSTTFLQRQLRYIYKVAYSQRIVLQRELICQMPLKKFTGRNNLRANFLNII